MDVQIYDHKDVKSYKLINKCNVILIKIPTKLLMTLDKKNAKMYVLSTEQQ